MKRISVDMDGVIANVYSQFMKMYTAENGKVITLEDAVGKFEHEVFENAYQYVTSPGFFRHAPVMEGSQQVMEKLNDHYKIFIVSAAMEFPTSLGEKRAWLNEHFPFIGWQQMVFCGSKEIIKADIMIDDHFKNLNYFTGETILFTQPHNQLADDGVHKRVYNWQQIEQLLLP
jgi:5'-nucleotidase